LHDRRFVGIRTGRLEHDELWTFVGKNTSRAIFAYRIGKRDGSTTDDFIQDIRQRVLGAPEISTDGFKPYQQSIRDAFRKQRRRVTVATFGKGPQNDGN
jgi:IS1 family transposase